VYTTGHYELFHKARGECQQRGYSLFKNWFVPLTLHKNKREHAESLKIVHFYVKIFSDISGPDYLSVSSAL